MDLRARPLSTHHRGGAGAVAAVEQREAVGLAVPYRGIHPFRFADHEIFFAREEETDELRDLVAIYRGVALYGPSGVGKSSLINAGLLPRVIRSGLRPERFRVQPEPGAELVVERIQVGDEPDDLLPSLLSSGTEATARAVLSIADLEARVAAAARSHRLLLIFDQFEELLTLFDRPGAAKCREEIVAMLVRFLRGNLPVKLLFSFRADYLAKVKDCLYAAPELVDQALHLTAPSAAGLPDIIRGPFQQPHLHFARELSPALTETLVALLGARFGSGAVSLSEVQTVCLRLWRAEQPEALLEQRGVQGILEDALEAALGELPTAPQRRAAVVLLANMVTDAGTRDIISAKALVARARADDGTLPEPLLLDVLARLEQNARLVRRETRRDLDLYEIASEYLLHWISRRREELRRDAEQRRYRRRMRLVIAGLVLLLGFMGVLVWQRERARAQAERARAAELAASARALLGIDPLGALRAAQAAVRKRPTAEPVAALRSALARPDVHAAFDGRFGAVRSFRVSPDGARAAVAASDGGPKIWPLAGRGPPVALAAKGVRSVDFSPDGRKIAVAARDGVQVYDVEGGGPTARIPIRGGAATVRWSPAGDRMAVIDRDHRAALWDVVGTTLLVDLGSATRVSWSPAGSRLASADLDGRVRVWSADGDRVAALPANPSRVTTLGFRDAGSRVLAARRDTGDVDVSGGLGCEQPANVRLSDARFTRDGGFVALATGTDVRVIELSTAFAGETSCRQTVLRSGPRPTGVAISADGRTVAATGSDGGIRVWDVRSRALLATLRGYAHSEARLDIRRAESGGEVVFAASDRGKLLAWQVPAVPVGTVFRGARVRAAAFTADGAEVLGATSKGLRRAARAGDDDGERVGPSVDIDAAAFSADGREAAAVLDDGTLAAMRVADGRWRQVAEGPFRRVTSLALAPDGRRLVVSSPGRGVDVLDTATGGPVEGPPAADDGPQPPAAAFAGDALVLAGREVRLFRPPFSGRGIELRGRLERSGGRTPPAVGAAAGGVVAARDGVLPGLWDVAHGGAATPLRGAGAVSALALSPDGTVAASAEAQRLQLWDGRSGQPLVTLASEFFSSVAFSPDGRWLIAGGPRGAQIFPCRPCGDAKALLAAAARLRAGPRLVPQKKASTDAPFTGSLKTRLAPVGEEPSTSTDDVPVALPTPAATATPQSTPEPPAPEPVPFDVGQEP